MLKGLWGDKKPSGLIYDALEETCNMLELEEGMFHAACDALLLGREPEEDVAREGCRGEERIHQGYGFYSRLHITSSRKL